MLSSSGLGLAVGAEGDLRVCSTNTEKTFWPEVCFPAQSQRYSPSSIQWRVIAGMFVTLVVNTKL